MSQSFTLILTVVALQFAVCRGTGCPRTITGRYAKFDEQEIVTESKEFAQKIDKSLSQLKTKAQGHPEPLDKISEFERREKALQQKEKVLHEDEAQLAAERQNHNNYSKETAELIRRKAALDNEKTKLDKVKREIAVLIIKAGNIAFVPGPNCIMFPPELQETFDAIEKQGILFGHTLAYPREGIDLDKPLGEAHLNKITSIESGKFFYQPLEFKIPTMSSPFDVLYHTLGAVCKGQFELALDSEKILNRYIGTKTFPEIFDFYIDKQFTPEFVQQLNIDPQDARLKSIKGTINSVSVTILTEFPTKDGSIKQSENKLTGKELEALGSDTLIDFTSKERWCICKEKGVALEKIRIKLTLILYYITE